MLCDVGGTLLSQLFEAEVLVIVDVFVGRISVGAIYLVM